MISFRPLFLMVVTVLSALTLSGVATVASPKDSAMPARPTVVDYSGKMVDEAGRPVSGVYPIDFKLYSRASRKPVWNDRMWVAVVDGAYTVGIGSQKLLPHGHDFTKLMLGVEISGVELSRQVFMDGDTAKKVQQDMEKKAAEVSDTKLAADSVRVGSPASNTGSVKYADSAGYAVSADHAKNADRIQNLTVEDLVRKVVEEGGGGAPGGSVTVGRTRRYGDRVGGPGGDIEYNEVCPKGYVMVGIRGGAGKFLDSIQIVCAPLGAE